MTERAPMIERFTERVDAGLRGLLVALMSLMVVTVTWQVAARYLLRAPSSYTAELSTFLLIWISLLGAAYALRMRAHLGIDLITRRLGDRANARVAVVSHLAVIAFALLVFVYGGARLVYVTFVLEQVSAAFQVPMGAVYAVVPLSGVLMVYYSLVALATEPATPAFLQEAVADPEARLHADEPDVPAPRRARP